MDLDWANLKYYAVENSKVNTKPSENRVVFMGDSIIEFWKDHQPEFFKEQAYINRGIRGQTTPQMLLRFRRDVINLKPEIVVILAGINDIAENTDPASIETIFGNIVSMVELAETYQIKVVLCSVTPAAKFSWNPKLKPIEKISKLNQMLQEYVQSKNLLYVDFYKELVTQNGALNSGYTKDGVHPNLAGYKVMKPLVEIALAESSKR